MGIYQQWIVRCFAVCLGLQTQAFEVLVWGIIRDIISKCQLLSIHNWWHVLFYIYVKKLVLNKLLKSIVNFSVHECFFFSIYSTHPDCQSSTRNFLGSADVRIQRLSTASRVWCLPRIKIRPNGTRLVFIVSPISRQIPSHIWKTQIIWQRLLRSAFWGKYA